MPWPPPSLEESDVACSSWPLSMAVASNTASQVLLTHRETSCGGIHLLSAKLPAHRGDHSIAPLMGLTLYVVSWQADLSPKEETKDLCAHQKKIQERLSHIPHKTETKGEQSSTWNKVMLLLELKKNYTIKKFH